MSDDVDQRQGGYPSDTTWVPYGHPRPSGRSPQGFPNWDAGVFRNDEGFTMEEAVVESEAIKEAAKAKQIERRLELKKEKERAAEADRVAALYDSS